AAGELEALVGKINEIRAKHGLNAIPIPGARR
ncbi:MAG: 50S ribosomal protein L7ae, partial [Pyrobaculum sp.]